MKKKYLLKTLSALAVLDIIASYLVYYTVKLGNTGKYNDWTLYNLSVVGYWDDYRRELITWGVITAFVFVGFLLYIRALTGEKLLGVSVLAGLAGVFLVVGVILPYRPWDYPLLSNLHIGCSLLAPSCLLAGLIAVTVRLYRKKMRFMLPMLIYLALGMGGAAYLFVKYTIITTTLEVFTISALTTYMTVLTLLLIVKNSRNVAN